jgi:hypothetical protein
VYENGNFLPKRMVENNTNLDFSEALWPDLDKLRRATVSKFLKGRQSHSSLNVNIFGFLEKRKQKSKKITITRQQRIYTPQH